MAQGDRIKAINAEAKATANLSKMESELAKMKEAYAKKENSYSKQEIDNLQKKIDKTNEYLSKVKGIKEGVDKFKETADTISLSARSTSQLNSAMNIMFKNMKAISSIDVSTTVGDTGVEFIQEFQAGASMMQEAQQNLMNADPNDQEAIDKYTEDLDVAKSMMDELGKKYAKFLGDNKKVNQQFQDFLGASKSVNEQIKVTSGLTADELEQYKELTAEADKMKTRFKAVGDQITTALKKPSLAIGLIIRGLGSVVSKVGEVTREFGGFVGGLTGATGQTALLSIAFKDASAVTKELANQFGGVEGSTFRTRLNTNLMAVNMGISGESAARLVGTLARSGDMTAQQAMDLAETTKQFAKQQGVIPSQAMEDIAQNAELFASYGAEATEELAKSAVQAAKLGLSMSSLGKVTDGLLDFESSITKELELSAMLGRNINLNKARALAFDGKIGASVKETIKQLGGQAAFEKMNVIQKRQAAEALGLSVEELSKMAKNMDKLNDDGSMQLSTFETMQQSLTAITTGPLGSMVKSLGTGLIVLGQMNFGLKSMGTSIGGIAGGMKNFVVNSTKGLANIIKMGAQKIFKGGAGGGMLSGLFKGKGPATPPPLPSGDGPGKGIGSITGAFSKIKMTDVVKGAAAMVLIAGSLFILGKALQQFSSVGLNEIGMAVLGLGILTAAMFGLGLLFTGPQAVLILNAAAGMFLIGAAVAALGFGINQLSSGFKTFGEIAPILGSLVSMVGGIFMLSAAFTALAGSLGLLGMMGIAALPTLLGLGVAGAGLGLLFGAFNGGGSSKSEEKEDDDSISVYQELVIQGLTAVKEAIDNKNMNVYLDGKLLNDFVRANSDGGGNQGATLLTAKK
jgi:hypothetical protein